MTRASGRTKRRLIKINFCGYFSRFIKTTAGLNSFHIGKTIKKKKRMRGLRGTNV